MPNLDMTQLTSLYGGFVDELARTYAGLDTVGLVLRLKRLVSDCPHSAQLRIQSALHDAFGYAANLSRSDGPFVDHLLRVTLRVVEELCHPVDADLVIAALLHDAVEDAPDYFAPGCGSEGALAVIERRYGPAVSQLVEALTMDDASSTAQYHTAVRALVRNNPDAALIKIADVIDNAGRLLLPNALSDNATVALAERYRPIASLIASQHARARVIGVRTPLAGAS